MIRNDSQLARITAQHASNYQAQMIPERRARNVSTGAGFYQGSLETSFVKDD